MHVNKIFRRAGIKARLFNSPSLKIAGVIVAGLAAILVSQFLGGPSLIQARNTTVGSAVPTYPTKDNPKTLPLSETPGSSPTPSSPKTIAAPPASGTPAADATPVCSKDISEYMRAYEADVKKEKRSLDDTLSFQVGLNISSKYVEDYNARVTKLYEKHAASAAADHCTLPIGGPTLLPTTYPN